MPLRTEYEVWRDEITADPRRVTLGWVVHQAAALFAVIGAAAFVITIAIGAR